MRGQRTICSLNRNVLCVLASLALYGVLAMSSMSLAESDQWVSKSNMPTARHGFGADVVNEKIYIIGGSVLSDIPVCFVEEYDVATDNWIRKTDMPASRKWLSASAVDGRIYVIGGVSANPLPTVEEYGPATDTWTKKASMPTARGGLSTCAVNGKIYAVGGMVGDPFPADPDVELYDPVTDTWEKKADAPTAGYAHSTVTVDGKIYALGGTKDVVAGPQTPITEEYTPEGWPFFAVSPQSKIAAVWGQIKCIK